MLRLGSRLPPLQRRRQGRATGVKVIDLFIYNGEPVVELRLPYLGPYVDEIVVVEGRTTFSGRAKPQLFVERDAGLFAPYKVHSSRLPPPASPGMQAPTMRHMRTSAAGRPWLEYRKTTRLASCALAEGVLARELRVLSRAPLRRRRSRSW